MPFWFHRHGMDMTLRMQQQMAKSGTKLGKGGMPTYPTHAPVYRYRAPWYIGLPGQRPSDILKMREHDIINRTLQITQAKTGKKLRISLEGELLDLINWLKDRKVKHTITSLHLIVDDAGQKLSYFMLRSHFNRARELVGFRKDVFQFRDLQAKAGTDKAESSGDIRQAQKQLGHVNVTMTETYIRGRKGDKITPTK